MIHTETKTWLFPSPSVVFTPNNYGNSKHYFKKVSERRFRRKKNTVKWPPLNCLQGPGKMRPLSGSDNAAQVKGSLVTVSGAKYTGQLAPNGPPRRSTARARGPGKPGHRGSGQSSLHNWVCGLRQATASLDSVSPSGNVEVRQNTALTSDMRFL